MITISNARASPGTLRYLRSAVAGQYSTSSSSTQRSSLRRSRNAQSLSMKSNASILPERCGRRAFFTSTRKRLNESTPSPPKTHYDFFPRTLSDGPPPTGPFSLDLKQLRNEFLQLQATAHPDRHHGAGNAAAQALSSRINEAYKTLQSPLLRAQYLLSLRGDDSHSDDSKKLGEEDEDQELLMEVLELREQIEEAVSEEEIRNLREENGARMADSVRVLEKAFREDDLGMARREAVRLRYWVNVEDTLHAWEKGEGVPPLQH